MLPAPYPMLLTLTLHPDPQPARIQAAVGGRRAPTTSTRRRGPRGFWATRKPAAACAIQHNRKKKRTHEAAFDEADSDQTLFDDDDDNIALACRQSDTVALGSTTHHHILKRRKTSACGLVVPYEACAEPPLYSTVPPPPYEVQVEPAPVRQTMDALLADVAAKTDKRECDLTDWQILKDLCAEANERYERDELASAAELLNAVLSECKRVLSILPDPSLLFEPERQQPYDFITPTQERLYPFRDWTLSHSDLRTSPNSSSASSPQASSPELPTAFHALLGTALFLLGNIIDRDADVVHSQSAQHEPLQPAIAYWLAALDVFETAENLPAVTDRAKDSEKEDWRMALVWGRTLVSLARAQLVLTREDTSARLPVGDPRLPQSVARGSIFTIIAAMRPPVTRRTSLARADAAELLVLAQDHFMRGILHMPHPQAADAPAIPGPTHEQTDPNFSRAHELCAVGMEMLSTAERLRVPAERAYWARQADFHLEQMRVKKRGADESEEVNLGLARRIQRAEAARGRCWLIVGRVYAAGSLVGEAGGLETRDAKKARDALGKAISFFEQATGPDGTEVQPLYTEALLSLASLTQDEGTREGLYARVALGTSQRSTEPDGMNVDGP
ncbi:unnamed protein product [Peniophora sp. CBMAI 1063]|nr:unnamed protein product [Peniophora sp. CBMAI 1063]